MADVVVVGGGPAGSATAALLAERGWEVRLLDRARFPRAKPCAEYLSPGAEPLLRQLGVFDRVAPRVGRRLRGMELCAPSGARHLVEYSVGHARRWGYALPRADLDAALLDAARARGVHVEEGVRVVGLLREPDGRVTGVRGLAASGAERDRRARLVIGADGSHSMVVRELKLQRPVRWPRRLGLVAHLRHVPWREDHGQMHVGPRGYVGVAPLDDGQEGLVSVGLVMPMPRGRLGSARAALEAALADYPEVRARVRDGSYVRTVQGVGPIAHAVSAPAGPGFLLVGDAAGFIDPFTGEGIYRALRGATLAAGLAHTALAEPRAAEALATEYAAARRAAFQTKELLTRFIQLFVHTPALMDYVVQRLAGRAELAARFGNVLGDLEPASGALRPAFLWALLRP